eukprot:2668584-Pyramimonas_sp.AAC.1
MASTANPTATTRAATGTCSQATRATSTPPPTQGAQAPPWEERRRLGQLTALAQTPSGRSSTSANRSWP